ncbi:MAG TPA: hypothetical protein VF081_02880 [Solirubrobacterales bacterium]
MTEVARALILPDLFAPSPESLLSLLLVWDEIELERCRIAPGSPLDYGEFREELREAGVVQEFPPPFELEPRVDPTLSIDESDAQIEELARSNGLVLASGILRSVRDAQSRATRQGFAALSTTQLADLASSLPPADEVAAVSEATMIQATINGMRLNSSTDLKAVLRFRDKNRDLMGRFRGALVDLSKAIDADTPTRGAEQGYALMRNRITPLLGDMASALDRGRLSYFVSTLFGATSLALAPIDPAMNAAAGGALMTRSLKYAFDRDRIVREHPYGLLYRMHQELARPRGAEPPRPISDPEEALVSICTDLMRDLHLGLRDMD